MKSTPSSDLLLRDLLSENETASIEAFGQAYRRNPSITTLCSYLKDSLGVLLATDPSIVCGYTNDESHLSGEAEALCRPHTPREVAALLRTCRAAGVPVTISAGRSNLTGSATPQGGVILSTRQLAVPELLVHAAERTVEAPVGMILEDLRQAVLEQTGRSMCYPVDPTSRAEATVGGTIACNASGFTPGDAGATRHWVKGIEVVLPCGGLLRLNRGDARTSTGRFRLHDACGTRELPVPRHPRAGIKNAGGPFSASDGSMDFVDLIIGSEGMFGVVTAVTLQLTEHPAECLDLFISLPGEPEALHLRQALAGRKEGGLAQFSAVEYFGLHCRRFMLHEERFFHGEDAVGMYLQIPLAQETDPVDEAETWLEFLSECGVNLDPDAILLLDNDRDRSLFLEARHSLPAHALETVQQRGTYTLMTDTVVPPEAFPEFLETTHALLQQKGIEYLAFGHLGDCHLHFTLLPEKSQLEEATRVYERIVAASAALGGVYSGEHGTGKRKRADFIACHGAFGVEEIRRAKAALDPEFLLNRGNVVA